VTRLPDQGATVERGDELYRVNEQPVTLLLGAIPMYRDLGPGDPGRDVRQLENNLAKLGYEGFTADDTYTPSTAEAVRAWQKDIGAEQTGTVARGDVVFVPEGGQVDSLHVDVGDPVSPEVPVLDITGTEQVVSLEVDIDDRDRFEVKTEVAVVLPGGGEVAGTVTATAVVEVVSEQDTDTESIVQAEVTLAEAAPEEFIGAPVDVIIGVDERADVLTVPVNALLALSEGGYGLEVVDDDGTTQIVAVDTGLFAEGRVEVSGADIAEGTVVGVAGR
jgi:peptidoglycan hydrolase-like protein with peptidoglycan-binding domain